MMTTTRTARMVIRITAMIRMIIRIMMITVVVKSRSSEILAEDMGLNLFPL